MRCEGDSNTEPVVIDRVASHHLDRYCVWIEDHTKIYDLRPKIS